MDQENNNSVIHLMGEVPERELLDLSLEGIHIPKESSSEVMRRIAKGLKSRKIDLYFPFFWTHSDVSKFHKSYIDKVPLDDLLWYLNELYRIVKDRYPKGLHWIERINIYHVYGLIRLIGKNDPKTAIRTIRKTINFQKQTKEKSVFYISANSTLAILQERETKEMSDFLKELITVPAFLHFYGSYQIYYYDGFENCISRLEKYINTSNEIFIPQSMLSLISIKSHIDWQTKKNTEPIIKERLFDVLGDKAKSMVDKYYKKVVELSI